MATQLLHRRELRAHRGDRERADFLKQTAAGEDEDEGEGKDGEEGMLELGMRFVGSWIEFQGLRINPETSSGMTVRNYLLDDFDVTAKPELFKEMAITFALIEVGRS